MTPAITLPGLDLEEVIDFPAGSPRCRRARFQFPYVGLDGVVASATGNIFLPAGFDPGNPVPLLYVAGYEVDPFYLLWSGAGDALARGFVVVNPAAPAPGSTQPGDNALARGTNLDVALLHLARSLDFVDNRSVFVEGWSAGGYTTLLLAAETFPLLGAMPLVAPLDLGYEAAYMTGNAEVHPPFAIAAFVVGQAAQAYGTFPSDNWWRHSPLAHTGTVTCPVSLPMSSADLLVPVRQVAERLQDVDVESMPAGFFVVPPDREDPLPNLETTVAAADLEVTVTGLPPGVVRMPAEGSGEPIPQFTNVPIAVSGRRWHAVVVDEGPIDGGMTSHFKHAVRFDHADFVSTRLAEGIAVEQLTAAKLGLLLDRCIGREWLAPGFRRLDRPEAERADVARGLLAYLESDAHAARLMELAAALEEVDSVFPGMRQAGNLTELRAVLEESTPG